MRFLRAGVLLVVASVAGLAQTAPAPTQTPAATPATTTDLNFPTPAHPITAEQAHEIYRLVGTEALTKQIIRQAIAAQRASSPEYIPASVWKDMEESFLKVDFAVLALPTYQRYLSTDDGDRIIEFYKTPEGQHLVALLPVLMTDVGRRGQQEGQRIAAEVLARHQQEMIDAKRKYDEQQRKVDENLSKPEPAKPELAKPQ